MPVWCIYALVDPRTEQERYVGKTTRTRVRTRMREHLRHQDGSARAAWIAELLSLNLKPDVTVLEEGTGDWCAAERRWIATYRAAGIVLLNGTDGGEGLRGASASTRQKIAAAQQMRWSGPDREQALAAARAPARRKAISDGLRGQKKTPEHVANLPQNQPGYEWSSEVRAQRRVNLLTRAAPVARSKSRSAAQIEVLREIQEANVGKPGWARGRVMADDERAARSSALRGRPKTEEHRERIRQAALRRWARAREPAPALDPAAPAIDATSA